MKKSILLIALAFSTVAVLSCIEHVKKEPVEIVNGSDTITSMNFSTSSFEFTNDFDTASVVVLEDNSKSVEILCGVNNYSMEKLVVYPCLKIPDRQRKTMANSYTKITTNDSYYITEIIPNRRC